MSPQGPYRCDFFYPPANAANLWLVCQFIKGGTAADEYDTENFAFYIFSQGQTLVVHKFVGRYDVNALPTKNGDAGWTIVTIDLY